MVRNSPNYIKGLVLKLYKEMLPSNAVSWAALSRQYQVESEEIVARDPADIKRFFIQKLCNSNKKPTGEASAKREVAKAQKIYHLILAKEFWIEYRRNLIQTYFMSAEIVK